MNLDLGNASGHSGPCFLFLVYDGSVELPLVSYFSVPWIDYRNSQCYVSLND